MKTEVIVLGSGGHASVLIAALLLQPNMKIIGMLDVNPSYVGKEVLGIKVIGTEEDIVKFAPQQVMLVNGLGSTNVSSLRVNVFKKFKALGYQFATCVHPTAFIGKNAALGEGAQVMAGCIIQPGCTVGDNTIINTRAALDHDCDIGHHVHIAPGAVLCGQVKVGRMTHVGSGATIVQSIAIGEECLIGAGAVVIHDLADKMRVAGVPAKALKNVREENLSEQLA